MTGSKVLVERRGTVSVLTLNRPEVRNCIDAETASLLSRAIESFAVDEEASVLVVTGADTDAFCSEADLKDIEALIARDAGRRRAPLGFSDLEPGKPRIAAVEGGGASPAGSSWPAGATSPSPDAERCSWRSAVGGAFRGWTAAPSG